MSCKPEKPEVSTLKTHELLLKAQLLLAEIEELLDLSISSQPPCQRKMILQECQASIEQDGETLVIDGVRFECTASQGDLGGLSSQDAAAGGCQGDT